MISVFHQRKLIYYNTKKARDISENEKELEEKIFSSVGNQREKII